MGGGVGGGVGGGGGGAVAAGGEGYQQQEDDETCLPDDKIHLQKQDIFVKTRSKDICGNMIICENMIDL